MFKLRQTNYICDNASEGTKFLLANGFFGFRGTLDEHKKDSLVALNIGNLYDGVAGKWRETVNAPNPLFAEICVDGILLNGQNVVSHIQELDILHSTFFRKTQFEVNGKTCTVESLRFLEEQNFNCLHSRLSIQCDSQADVEIVCAIDSDVWDINGPHLQEIQLFANNFVQCKAITQENKIPLTVGLLAKSQLNFEKFVTDKNTCGYKFAQTIQPQKIYTIDRFCCVCVGNENSQSNNSSTQNFCNADEIERTQNTHEVTCKSILEKASQAGFDSLLHIHKNAWQKKWDIADVQLEGDSDAQFALRFSIFQLLSLSPKTTHSISARGLSGQTYKGAIFWDTEMFLLPFYQMTAPNVAKKLLQYRINCLNQAVKKARQYGFDGAFFAWESQENGQDACSDFNVTDVFTNRPLRTFFKDKQIHISGDIAVALYKYSKICKDVDILAEGGCQLLLQCALFYFSRAYFNHIKNRFELLDVLGPDEYHERVNNNAYTNYIAYYTTVFALGALKDLQNSHNNVFCQLQNQFGKQLLQQLQHFADNLYLPSQNQQGIIEQFDGYFELEDTSVQNVASRLLHPKEYWGGANGVASHTRVIKQADVVTMFCVFDNVFDKQTVQKNWQFYLPYTEHGSSLSYSMYSLSACKIGKPDSAYPYFVKTASVDLSGKSKQYAGTIYIGGTHPASCGGAWMTAVFGFGGLSFDSNGSPTVQPNLPKNITKLSYKFFDNNTLKQVTATHDGFTVKEIQ